MEIDIMEVLNRFTGKPIGDFDIAPNADLSDANLSHADLHKADLSYANLHKANLSYANLSYAKDQFGTLVKIISGPTREVEPYRFDLRIYSDHDPVVFAGCRQFAITEYRQHTETYRNPTKQRQTMAILDYFEVLLKMAS